MGVKAVIIDVDGTLADVRGIRHYVAGPERNFHLFHGASLFCPPNRDVVALTHAFRDDVARLVVTARENRWDYVTTCWLQKYGVRYDRLFMRAWGDYRPDFDVKRDILAAIRADGFDPVYAIDDNPAVIDLWKQEGIPTLVVPGWGE